MVSDVKKKKRSFESLRYLKIIGTSILPTIPSLHGFLIEQKYYDSQKIVYRFYTRLFPLNVIFDSERRE